MGIIAVFIRPHTGFLCKRTECFVTVFRERIFQQGYAMSAGEKTMQSHCFVTGLLTSRADDWLSDIPVMCSRSRSFRRGAHCAPFCLQAWTGFSTGGRRSNAYIPPVTRLPAMIATKYIPTCPTAWGMARTNNPP